MSTRKNDDLPESGGVDIRNEELGMGRGDKLALSLIAVVFFAICFGLMIAVKWFFSTFFGMFDVIDDGIGLRGAFMIGVVLSFITIILFAIVAGEGVVGELPTMIIGVFIMILFFTFSIAFVF
jgi:hypothetical protein